MAEQHATATPEQAKKNRRVQLVGRVISDKMEKTRVVAVETLKKHRIYKRTYKQTKHYYAHDENNTSHLGDLVRIEESRPLSRLKRWRLLEVVQQSKGVFPVDDSDVVRTESASGEEK